MPLCIGVSIRTPDQAAAIARLSDDVVVGSALMDWIVKANSSGQAVNDVPTVCSELSFGVRGARSGSFRSRSSHPAGR
ncbi:tryptophan synthase subunit alpha [Pseudomonas sp. Q2-TVG4-2]|uniref:tryptophan synthase subunit alpha n=1 Tax=Pseudomonas sp. Q2-TVG4-2 TaxID=1685699 RepID=UPI0015E7B690